MIDVLAAYTQCVTHIDLVGLYAQPDSMFFSFLSFFSSLLSLILTFANFREKNMCYELQRDPSRIHWKFITECA